MAPTKRKQPQPPPTSDTTVRRSSRLANTSAAAPPLPPTAEPKKKKSKKTVTVEAKPVLELETNEASEKTVVIEHCKQCNAFKTRAILVKEGLEKGVVGGVNVLVNPEKPRRGCFEVREESGGEVFVSLLDMKRPFQKMKDLDMEKLVSEIVDKINSTK